MGKSITPARPCRMGQVAIHGGRGRGARFMKNDAPAMPSG